jgi:hypothetical protein
LLVGRLLNKKSVPIETIASHLFALCDKWQLLLIRQDIE